MGSGDTSLAGCALVGDSAFEVALFHEVPFLPLEQAVGLLAGDRDGQCNERANAPVS